MTSVSISMISVLVSVHEPLPRKYILERTYPFRRKNYITWKLLKYQPKPLLSLILEDDLDNTFIVNDIVNRLRRELARLFQSSGAYHYDIAPVPLTSLESLDQYKLTEYIKKYRSEDQDARQKAEVIGIWIGEILYEASAYKDVKTAKSFTETIRTEIGELINESN